MLSGRSQARSADEDPSTSNKGRSQSGHSSVHENGTSSQQSRSAAAQEGSSTSRSLPRSASWRAHSTPPLSARTLPRGMTEESAGLRASSTITGSLVRPGGNSTGAALSAHDDLREPWAAQFAATVSETVPLPVPVPEPAGSRRSSSARSGGQGWCGWAWEAGSGRADSVPPVANAETSQSPQEIWQQRLQPPVQATPSGSQRSHRTAGSEHPPSSDINESPIGTIRTLVRGVPQMEDDIARIEDVPSSVDGDLIEVPPGTGKGKGCCARWRCNIRKHLARLGGCLCFFCRRRRRSHGFLLDAFNEDEEVVAGSPAHDEAHGSTSEPVAVAEIPIISVVSDGAPAVASIAPSGTTVAAAALVGEPLTPGADLVTFASEPRTSPRTRQSLPVIWKVEDPNTKEWLIAMAPVACMLVLWLLPLILLLVAWTGSETLVSEGGFGKLTQVDEERALAYAAFTEAAKLTVTDRALPSGARLNLSSAGGSYIWKRFQVLFPVGSTEVAGGIAGPQGIDRLLQGMSAWTAACATAQTESQELCLPGYSLGAIAYAERVEPNQSRSAAGVQHEVVHSGNSNSQALPADVLMSLLPRIHDAMLSNLVEFYSEGASVLGILKSTFQFLIPAEDATSTWKDLLSEHVIPELHPNAAGGQVFFRGDDAEVLSTSYAFWQDRPGIIFPTFLIFVITWIVSGRWVVSLSTLFVVFLGAGSSTSSVSSLNNDMVPGIAVAAAFMAACLAPSMAISTSSCWERMGHDPLAKLKKDRWLIPRWLGLILGPATVLFFVFLTLSAVVQAEILREFTLAAMLGVLFVTLFVLILIAPSTLLGDFLPQRLPIIPRLRKRVRRRIRRHSKLPEAVQKHWNNFTAAMPMGWSKLLVRSSVRCLSIGLAIALFLLLMIEVGAGGISWALSNERPSLFEEGHYQHDQAVVFDHVLPIPPATSRPLRPLASSTECEVATDDETTCDWHYCRESAQGASAAGQCSCFALTSAVTDGCKLQASIWGARSQDLTAAAVDELFWPQLIGLVQNRGFDQEDVENRSSSTLAAGSPIIMEDRSTGNIVLEEQFRVSSVGPDFDVNDSQVPVCLRAHCFCGALACPPGSGYRSIGTINMNRRLAFAGVELEDKDAEAAEPSPLQSEAESPAAPGTSLFTSSMPAGSRRLTAGDQVYVASQVIPPGPPGTVPLSVVWGVAQLQEAPDRGYASAPGFSSFEVDEPWMQRHIHSICTGTSPDLGVVSRHCWISDFRDWLQRRGRRFPVLKGGFYQAFDEWASEGGNANYRQFWFEDGVMQGTFIVFHVQAPGVRDEALSGYMDKWEGYLGARNGMAGTLDVLSAASPAQAWISSSLFAEVTERDALESALIWPSVVVFLFLLVACLAMSCNLGMTLAVVLTFGVGLCGFGLFAWAMIGDTITWLEVTTLLTFLPCFAHSLLQFAVAYTLSLWEIGPVKPPRRERLGKNAKGGLPMVGLHALNNSNNNTNAVKKKKSEQHLWLGCVAKERRMRMFTVFSGEGKAILAFALSAGVAGLSLATSQTGGLAGVGYGLLATAWVVPLFTLGFLPVLLFCGLGPTRTRRLALWRLKDWKMPLPPADDIQLQFPADRLDEEDFEEEQLKPHQLEIRLNETEREEAGKLAAQVLGLPFTLMIQPEAPGAPKTGQSAAGSPRLDLSGLARALPPAPYQSTPLGGGWSKSTTDLALISPQPLTSGERGTAATGLSPSLSPRILIGSSDGGSVAGSHRSVAGSHRSLSRGNSVTGSLRIVDTE